MFVLLEPLKRSISKDVGKGRGIRVHGVRASWVKSKEWLIDYEVTTKQFLFKKPSAKCHFINIFNVYFTCRTEQKTARLGTLQREPLPCRAIKSAFLRRSSADSHLNYYWKVQKRIATRHVKVLPDSTGQFCAKMLIKGPNCRLWQVGRRSSSGSYFCLGLALLSLFIQCSTGKCQVPKKKAICSKRSFVVSA